MQGGQPGPWHFKAIISRDLSRQGEGEGATGDFPAPALPLQPFWQQVFRDQTGRQVMYPGHGERIALAVSGRRHHPKQMSFI